MNEQSFGDKLRQTAETMRVTGEMLSAAITAPLLGIAETRMEKLAPGIDALMGGVDAYLASQKAKRTVRRRK